MMPQAQRSFVGLPPIGRHALSLSNGPSRLPCPSRDGPAASAGPAKWIGPLLLTLVLFAGIASAAEFDLSALPAYAPTAEKLSGTIRNHGNGYAGVPR